MYETGSYAVLVSGMLFVSERQQIHFLAHKGQSYHISVFQSIAEETDVLPACVLFGAVISYKATFCMKQTSEI